MKWGSDPHPTVKKSHPLLLFLTPHAPCPKTETPFNWRQKNMTLMHKLNEHAMFIFLLFCKKSRKYQNIDVFKFHCTIYGLYMYTG